MRIVKVVVNAVALLVAGLLVPGITIDWGDEAIGAVVVLVVLAIAFGLVNALLRPIAKLVSMPLNIATLGLFSLVINALLLLAVAFLVDVLWQPLIVIGGFPPDITVDAVVAAIAGSLVISGVSTVLNILIPDA